jgi:hypothetical protein
MSTTAVEVGGFAPESPEALRALRAARSASVDVENVAVRGRLRRTAPKSWHIVAHRRKFV